MKSKKLFFLSLLLIPLVGCNRHSGFSHSSLVVSSSETSSEDISSSSVSEEEESNKSNEEESSIEESSFSELSEDISSLEESSVEESSELSSEHSSEESSEEESEGYHEGTDVVDGDPSDITLLVDAFQNISSYACEIRSYFNENGLYDYYRHYHQDYVCNSLHLYRPDYMYATGLWGEGFDSLNTGLFNKTDGYYSFKKEGSTFEERLDNEPIDLELAKADAKYQDDTFMLDDLNETYFLTNGFSRINAKKYQSTSLAACEDFVNICAPTLINDGHYMTFSRVTVELDLNEELAFRIRLYASPTQIGKLIDSHLDKDDKPNWYLLFSEAIVSLKFYSIN